MLEKDLDEAVLREQMRASYFKQKESARADPADGAARREEWFEPVIRLTVPRDERNQKLDYWLDGVEEARRRARGE